MSAFHYNNPSADGQSYFMPLDIETRNCDDTSSDSSSNATLDGSIFDGLYNASDYMPFQEFPMACPMKGSMVPIRPMPTELDVTESPHEDYDRRKKGSGKGKVPNPHATSRRRAQNRRSQRAFRARKEERLRELEGQLEECEGRYKNLSKLYESLQAEYCSVAEQLNKLNKVYKGKAGFGDQSNILESLKSIKWEDLEGETMKLLLCDDFPLLCLG